MKNTASKYIFIETVENDWQLNEKIIILIYIYMLNDLLRAKGYNKFSS